MSSDTVQIVWSPVRGAEMYETKAVDWTNELLCNDTATVCTLSALQCNTQYNVTVYSFSEIRGSNTSCASKHVVTGTTLYFPEYESYYIMHPKKTNYSYFIIFAVCHILHNTSEREHVGKNFYLLFIYFFQISDLWFILSAAPLAICVHIYWQRATIL